MPSLAQQPPWLLLALALFSAALALNARRPARGPLPFVWLSFFAGWFTVELAGFHLIFQGGLVLYLAEGGALSAWPGWLGAGIVAVAWWTLLRLHREGAGAWRVAADALDAHLPSAAPPSRTPRPRLRHRLFPFSMRAPGVERIRDVVFYSEDGAPLTADVFRRRDVESGAPVLLYVHGGGWSMGFRRFQGLPMLNGLAARGWVCVSAGYRLSPEVTYPAHLLDVKRAVAWARQNAERYGGDASFLAIAGSSAGGHLATMAALTWDDPETDPFDSQRDLHVDACVSFYGHYDLLDRSDIDAPGLRELLEEKVFKRSMADAPEIFDRASPLAWLRPDAPPMLLIHGEKDSLVPPAEGRDFAARLREVSSQAVIHVEIPGAQHAFEMFRSARGHHAIEATVEFLRRVGGRGGASLLLLLGLASVLGCDKSGIHPLGLRGDVVEQCSGPNSTWLSSTSEGVEWLLVGSEDPAGDPTSDGSRCFAFGFIEHDTTSWMEAGTYTLNASGQGQVFTRTRYDFPFEPELGILQRSGATRQDYLPYLVNDLTIVEDAGQLLVTLRARTRRMTDLYEVMARLDPTSLEGATDLNRLLNLPILTSQSRVIGFGSGGMTQYVDSPGVFDGLVAGSQRVVVSSLLMPDTTIDLMAFEDVSGIVLGGQQFTSVDLAGEGTTTGTMLWKLRGSDDPADILFEGDLVINVNIEDGLPMGGDGEMNIAGGGTFVIGEAPSRTMDFRNFLPVEAP